MKTSNNNKADLRLQVFLAQAGIASRRQAEKYILDGRVKVNGKVVRELGTKINPQKDQVDFNGTRVVAENHVWVLLNKPDGTVSTVSDPEGRPTVLDIVGNYGVRLYPVGRLDYHTEGVLLLTNDGQLANALMHPRQQVPRVYHVKIKGDISVDALDQLREGVRLDTGETVKAETFVLGNTEKNTWIQMTLRQGLHHQIHRMIEVVGTSVLKLVRVAYANLTTDGLRPGEHRLLSQGEINELRELVKLPQETQRKATKPEGKRQNRNTNKRATAPKKEQRPNRASRPNSASKKNPTKKGYAPTSQRRKSPDKSKPQSTRRK